MLRISWRGGAQVKAERRIIEFPVEAEQAYQALRAGLGGVLPVEHADDSEMLVAFQSKARWLSWGERVECRVIPLSRGVRVVLQCRPVLWWNMSARPNAAVDAVVARLQQNFGPANNTLTGGRTP